MGNAFVDLSQHRLRQAKQCIQSAKVLRDIDDYKGAANRSYYAIFHAMSIRTKRFFKAFRR